MPRKSMPVLGLTLLAALALVAAGCGGGGKSKSAATTTATETTAPATTEAATTEAATTEAATTQASPTTTSNLSGFASTKNCREFAGLAQKFSAAFSGSTSGANIKKEAELFQQFADKAPSDIRADFQTVAAYFSKVADVAGSLKPGQTPDAATLAKLQKLSTEIDQAKLTQASQRITAWVQKNCTG